MELPHNPFVWERPLTEPSAIVGMDGFAADVARRLRAGTDVAVFGPPGAGKSTFVNRLTRELDTAVISLGRVLSRAGLQRRLAELALPSAGRVVVLEDVEHLHRATANPEPIIRLVTGDAPLLFTSSIRDALTAIPDSVVLPLPQLGRMEFAAHLGGRFAATDKPADEDAVAHLLDAAAGHPRSIQRLAGASWEATAPGEHVTLGTVIYAHDQLVEPADRPAFAAIYGALAGGGEAEVNEARALQLLADRGPARLTSRPVVARYGFSSHSRVRPALERLRRRGLVDRRDGAWQIADPLFAEWLRRSSPLQEGEPAAAFDD